MVVHLMYRAEVFEEDAQFVALCPELNVSTYGDSVEQARGSLKEAMGLFLEECDAMGTLEAVLREAGFSPDSLDRQKWISRLPILVEQVSL